MIQVTIVPLVRFERALKLVTKRWFWDELVAKSDPLGSFYGYPHHFAADTPRQVTALPRLNWGLHPPLGCEETQHDGARRTQGSMGRRQDKISTGQLRTPRSGASFLIQFLGGAGDYNRRLEGPDASRTSRSCQELWRPRLARLEEGRTRRGNQKGSTAIEA